MRKRSFVMIWKATLANHHDDQSAVIEYDGDRDLYFARIKRRMSYDYRSKSFRPQAIKVLVQRTGYGMAKAFETLRRRIEREFRRAA